MATGPTSEGQRLLVDLDVGGPELAEQLGCSRQAVHLWRSGEKRPGRATRAKLEELHKIRDAAWFELPRAPEAPTPPTPTPPSVEGLDARDRDELREVGELIAAARAARTNTAITPSERNQLIRTESDLLRRRSEIEDRNERFRLFDKKLEHEVVVTILDVLKRFPNVESEVLGQLRVLKRSTGT